MSDSDVPEQTPPPAPPPPQPGPDPVLYAPSPTMPTPEGVTATTGKADLTKRFVAFIVDAVIAGVLTSILAPFGSILGGLYMLLRDGFDFEFMRYRSLGKRLMGLRPVLVEGGAMTMQVSVRRNWPFALGILMFIPILGWFIAIVLGPIFGLVEGLLVITDDQGRRYGDKMAGTKVLESKD